MNSHRLGIVLLIILFCFLSVAWVSADEPEATDEAPVVVVESPALDKSPIDDIELQSEQSHNNLILGIVQSLSVATTIITSIIGGLYLHGKTIAQAASGQLEDAAMKLMEVAVVLTKDNAELYGHVRQSLETLGYRLDASGNVIDPNRVADGTPIT